MPVVVADHFGSTKLVVLAAVADHFGTFVVDHFDTPVVVLADHFGTFVVAAVDHFGTPVVVLADHFGTFVFVVAGHFGTPVVVVADHFGTFVVAAVDHFGTPVVVLADHFGTFVVVAVDHFGSFVAAAVDHFGTPVVVVADHFGTFVVAAVDHFGSFVAAAVDHFGTQWYVRCGRSLAAVADCHCNPPVVFGTPRLALADHCGTVVVSQWSSVAAAVVDVGTLFAGVGELVETVAVQNWFQFLESPDPGGLRNPIPIHWNRNRGMTVWEMTCYLK